MSESASAADNFGASADKPERLAAGKDGKRPNIFRRIALFVRQVVAELKKVVRPTRSELVTYTIVVLVFVSVMMVFITGVDFVIGRAVFEIFGG